MTVLEAILFKILQLSLTFFNSRYWKNINQLRSFHYKYCYFRIWKNRDSDLQFLPTKKRTKTKKYNHLYPKLFGPSTISVVCHYHYWKLILAFLWYLLTLKGFEIWALNVSLIYGFRYKNVLSRYLHGQSAYFTI